MNANENEKIEKFIKLRSQNETFPDMAAELNVSERTLFRWSRLYQPLIQNLREARRECQAERCKLSRRFLLQDIGEDLRRVREELSKRDLKDLPTAKLFDLAAQLRTQASTVNGPLRLSEPISEVGRR